MLSAGGDDFLCDMAETYGVLEPRVLPPRTLAALAAGLPENARVRRRMAGASEGPAVNTQLLAAVVDQLALLRWQLFSGREDQRPASVLGQLCGGDPPDKGPDGPRQNGTLCSFDSPEEFEAARARVLRGGNG